MVLQALWVHSKIKPYDPVRSYASMALNPKPCTVNWSLPNFPEDWTGSSWNSGWWESGKQTHWQRREAFEDRADAAEGSHA